MPLPDHLAGTVGRLVLDTCLSRAYHDQRCAVAGLHVLTCRPGHRPFCGRVAGSLLTAAGFHLVTNTLQGLLGASIEIGTRSGAIIEIARTRETKLRVAVQYRPIYQNIEKLIRENCADLADRKRSKIIFHLTKPKFQEMNHDIGRATAESNSPTIRVLCTRLPAVPFKKMEYY